MICPYCGRTTRFKEYCEHCKQPTEFVKRSNVQPGAIPGERESIMVHTEKLATNKNEKQINKRLLYAAVLAIAVVLSTVTSWMICLQFSTKQAHLEETTQPSEYQVDQIPEEGSKKEHRVFFQYNFPEQNDNAKNPENIYFGEIIPKLKDGEGYMFLEWNTDPVGAGTSFKPGDCFLIPLAEDLVLYGQWEKNVIHQIQEETFPNIDNLELFLREPEDEKVTDDTVVETAPIREGNAQTENTESGETK